MDRFLKQWQVGDNKDENNNTIDRTETTAVATLTCSNIDSTSNDDNNNDNNSNNNNHSSNINNSNIEINNNNSNNNNKTTAETLTTTMRNNCSKSDIKNANKKKPTLLFSTDKIHNKQSVWIYLQHDFKFNPEKASIPIIAKE